MIGSTSYPFHPQARVGIDQQLPAFTSDKRHAGDWMHSNVDAKTLIKRGLFFHGLVSAVLDYFRTFPACLFSASHRKARCIFYHHTGFQPATH